MKNARKPKPSGLGHIDDQLAIQRALAIAKEVTLEQTSSVNPTEAAAMAKMRDEINSMDALCVRLPDAWQLEDIIQILTIFQELLETTMSSSTTTEDSVTIIRVHPVASMVSEFISALRDFENGVIDPRLRRKTPPNGQSLRTSDRQTIGLALTLIEILRKAKGLQVDQAQTKVEKTLKKMGFRIRGKEMTKARLVEWAKDYDLAGKKKKGN
jgi:hypothetical protein